MKYFLLILTSIFMNIALGQNNAEVKGKVYDLDRKPLEKATVSIVSAKDSLVLSYALTNEKGEFNMVKIPTKKPLILFISHVSSSAYQKNLEFKDGEKLVLDSVFMRGNTIEEVEIKAVAPIRLNGDTLEYKADYFKTRPNATVEELLSILPGLQVNADGTIYYQGREVSGVRVNNKDFFAQDLKIATRNLDASLIDIVQIIKDKGESKREILDDSELPIVINLKMKKEFLKANFGKLYGGAATRDRYESGALINTFRDTLQVSFIGFANNIGRQGFDYQELGEYGGYNRGESMNYSYWGTNGLMNQISAGINVNYDIKDKLKTNLMYNFGKMSFYSDSENKSNNFYDEIEEQSAGKSYSENDRYTHEIKSLLRYKFDTTSQVTYRGSISVNNNNNFYTSNSDRWRSNQEPVLSSQNINNGDNKNFSFNQSIYFEKKFSNKWLLGLNHNYNNSNQKNLRNSLSNQRFYLFNDSLINQENIFNTLGYTSNLDHKINLQVPIGKKVNFDIYSQYIIEHQSEEEDILNKINADDFINRNDIANNKGLNTNSFIVGTGWNLRVIKDMPISLNLRWLNLKNNFDYYERRDNISNSTSQLLPSFSVSYKGLNLNYSKQVNKPSFYTMVVIDSDLYPTRLTYASPYFDNVLQDRMEIRYNKFFQKSKINLFISGRYTKSDKSIAQDITYDVNNSFSTNQFYQAGETDGYFVNFNFSKTFLQNNTWKLSYSLSSYASLDESYSKVNGEENLSTRSWGNLTNTITFGYKNKFTFTPTYIYGINNTTFKYESDNFRNLNNGQHSFGASFMLNDVKKFRLESSYTLKNQITGLNNQRQNLHILNASVYYPIFGQGELKLSAFDILNQNISNSFYTYSNSTNYSQTTTLRQYFMLGLVYKFLKTGDKK